MRTISKAPRGRLAACDDVTVIGAPFYVMQRVHGPILRQPRLPRGLDLGPPQLRGLSEAVVDALIELHAVDPAAAGLGGPGPAGRLHRPPGERLDRAVAPRRDRTGRRRRARRGLAGRASAAAHAGRGKRLPPPPAAQRLQVRQPGPDRRLPRRRRSAGLGDGDGRRAAAGPLARALAYWLDPGRPRGAPAAAGQADRAPRQPRGRAARSSSATPEEPAATPPTSCSTTCSACSKWP